MPVSRIKGPAFPENTWDLSRAVSFSGTHSYRTEHAGELIAPKRCRKGQFGVIAAISLPLELMIGTNLLFLKSLGESESADCLWASCQCPTRPRTILHV